MTSFEAYFQKHGHIAKQWIWEHTIYQVTRLFEEAEQRVRSEDGKLAYWDLEGWWRKKPVKFGGKDKHRIPDETSISEALFTEMEKVQQEFIVNKSALGSDLADIDLLHFHPEAPRRNKRGIGPKSKPTDFRFYRSGLGLIDLRIEAKVVVKESEIEGTYLSTAGMARFSDPTEPYTDDLVGGMVAYTVSKSRKDWERKIDEGLRNSQPAIPTFFHAVIPSAQPSLFSQVPFNFEVKPPRKELLVFHMVLEMDCSPPAR